MYSIIKLMIFAGMGVSEVKKTVAFLVILIVFALGAFSAEAEVESSLNFNYNRHTLRINVRGLMEDSSYFLLITQNGDTVAEAILPWNIVFMDMVTSNEDGTLDIALVNMGIEPGCSVLLGGAFEECVSPYVVGTIEHTAFQYLPESLTVIDAESFMGSSFTSLYLGEGVSVIGDRAFKDCKLLRTVYIANDHVTFGEDVFAGCSNVVLVCSEGSTAEAYAALFNNVTCQYR